MIISGSFQAVKFTHASRRPSLQWRGKLARQSYNMLCHGGGVTCTHVSVDAKVAAPSPNINVVSPCNACCLQNRFRSTLKFRGKGAREVDQIVSGQFFPPPSECQEIRVLRAIFDWSLRALAPIRNRIPIGLHACLNRNKCCPVLVVVQYYCCSVWAVMLECLLFNIGCCAIWATHFWPFLFIDQRVLQEL